MSVAYHLIYNPNAARGKNKHLVPHIASTLRKGNNQVELYETKRPHQATEIAAAIPAKSRIHIIAVGGDGTATEVMNGIMRNPARENCVFGVIPCGTGNDFLKDFGIRSVDEAIQRICNNNFYPIDVGKITLLDPPQEQPIYFMNLIGIGVIANGARLRRDVYAWAGKLGYHLAFVHLLPRLKTAFVQLSVDGGNTLQFETPVLGICNSQYTGNGMRISPRSNTQDGKLDLLYTEDITAWELLQLFAMLPSGRHMNHPKIHHTQFDQLQLEFHDEQLFMVDGEVKSGRVFQIGIHPQRLHFLR